MCFRRPVFLIDNKYKCELKCTMCICLQACLLRFTLPLKTTTLCMFSVVCFQVNEDDEEEHSSTRSKKKVVCLFFYKLTYRLYACQHLGQQ